MTLYTKTKSSLCTSLEKLGYTVICPPKKSTLPSRFYQLTHCTAINQCCGYTDPETPPCALAVAVFSISCWGWRGDIIFWERIKPVCCCPEPGPESPPNRPGISDTASPPAQYRYGNKIYVRSVTDLDPGSGAFLTPGSGIRNRFFRIPDLGSRIPNP